MELNKRTYLAAFTILGLAMCLYSGLQLVGAYVYVLASDWISGLEAGGFRWLSGLFASHLTRVPVQYLFVLGIPSLLVYLSVCWLSASKGTQKKVPASVIAAALVMAMGFGYVFNFTGTIINFGISLATGKSALEMNPVTEMLSMLEPGMILYVCLIGPFMEEVMFRGVFLRRARRFGDRTAILYTAVLFGMMHGNLTQFLYATAIGLILGYLAVSSNGIRYCVLVHVLINSYSTYLTLWSLFLENMGISLFTALFSFGVLAAVALFIAGAVWFFVSQGVFWWRELRARERSFGPGFRYVWENPGFFLFVVISLLEMVSYFL